MKLKLFIFSALICLTFYSRGQSVTPLTPLQGDNTDSSKIVIWKCGAGSSILQYPLIIINSKHFKKCLLQNLYFDFDTSNISSVQVINTQNDSIKLYGNAGKYGVIIIQTKKPINWISAKQIVRQKSNEINSSLKRTLIQVDSSSFGSNEVVYFQKELIKNISIRNNVSEYYGKNRFNSIVKIAIERRLKN